MAVKKARKRTLAACIAAAGLAAAIAMTVLPSSAVVLPSTVQLYKGTDGLMYFAYGNTTQQLKAAKNGCEIISAEPVIDLQTPTPGTANPGLGADGVGVKASKSSGNGTPCSQVDGAETLVLSAGASVGGRLFTKVRLDLEMTGNAVVTVTFTPPTGGSDGSKPRTYTLQTGSRIDDVQAGEADYDDDPNALPYDASSGPTDNVDACAAPNSSGPNSAGSDNCRWLIQPGFDFATMTLAVTNGTASLEGGSDLGGGAGVQTLLYLGNLTPTAGADSYSVAEDGSLVVPETSGVLANDTDDNTLTASLLTGTSHGSLTLNSNGSFSYSPTLNFNGTDSFTYRASDGTTTSDGTVTITVSSVNDLPFADDDTDEVDEGSFVDISVLNGDTDDDAGTTLSVTNIGGITPTGPPGATAMLAPGSTTVVRYTPPVGYTGPGGFTYKASDGTATSNTATVSVTVFPVICTTETVSDQDGVNTPEYTSGSFTRLVDDEVCKRYTVDADKGDPGTGDETVTFNPTGGTDPVKYRGVLQFPADAAPGPTSDGEYPLLLKYDPDGNDDFKPVQWCINPTFTGGLVTNASLPPGGEETWCIAKAETVPTGNPATLVTIWQVYGEDDPRFTR